MPEALHSRASLQPLIVQKRCNNSPAGMTRQGVFIKGFSQIEVQRDYNREAIN
jgi:hypothetical protein